MERNYYTGLGISKHHLSVVQLEKNTRGWHINTMARRTVGPDTLQISIKEKPIKNKENFTIALQDLLKDIKINTKTIAVSIPNEAVKLSLVPLNISLMDHDEAIQTIKWKLRETIPYETDSMQVSFQKINPTVDREESVIAAVVNREIVEQVEQLLLRKKLKAEVIGVSSLNHLNLYSDYLKAVSYTHLRAHET